MSQQTPSLESIITSDQVPTLPEVALEVLRVAQQPEPSMEELIHVIRMDPAIAGRIVKFANSPLFGIRKTEQTIEASVVMLGTTMIRTLVLGFSLADKKVATEELRPHFQQIWRETLFQAVAAEVLGERHKGIDPAVWFLGALIQDAGRLVMLNVFGKEYVERVIRCDSDASLCEREAQAFGFSHADVSAALCKTWNLGQEFADAVIQHHSARTTPSEDEATLSRALVSVSACNDYIEAVTGQAGVSREAVEQDLIELHHCCPDEVVEVLADIDSRAREMAGVLKADVGRMPSREQILERAQTTLLEIAVAEQLRRLNGDSDEESKPVEADPVTCKWLDSDTGAYAENLLDTILPEEIETSSEQQRTLGVLTVDAQADGTACSAEDLRSATTVIRQCVRPSDRIVRNGKSGLIVMLPELSMNMLAKVGRRIVEQATEALEESNVSVNIAGLMIVPAGRKIASLKSVLSGLEKSLKSARKDGNEHFQILQGRKLQVVQPAE